MERREGYACVVDRPEIGEHAEAFETGTGFMCAFRVLIAALASLSRRFRWSFMATPRPVAAHVHLMMSGHRMHVGAQNCPRRRFRVSGRKETAA